MNSDVTLTLTADEALVMFEFFARFDEDNEFTLRHNAEFVAFMSVSGQLEKALVVPFQSTYQEQLRGARERLADGCDGIAPGVKPLPADQPDA